MPRRKKREDGRVVQRLTVGRDAAGKPMYKWIYADTDAQLNKAVREYQNRLDAGMNPQNAEDSFYTLRTRWLEQRRLDDIGESWYRNLKQYSGHLASLDDIPAAEVKRSDIQAILNRLAQWHDGKPPLAHRTLSRIHKAAVDIFESGIPEVLAYNPATRCKVPQGAGREERQPISKEQQNWVRSFPHRARRAAMLMMLSGLRRGEATALTWGDIDLVEGTITVDKAIDFTTGKLKAPKSVAGVRVVVIPQELKTFLQAEKQAEEPLCMYVVHQTNGKRMTNSGWHKMWESYMAALNAEYGHGGANRFSPRKKQEDGTAQGPLPMVIETFTPHQLRHTYATILYLAGVDVLTARDQLGHSDIKTTLEIYTHLDKLYKRSSMDKLNIYLENSVSQSVSQKSKNNETACKIGS